MRRFLSLSIIILTVVLTLLPLTVARADGPADLSEWTIHHRSELLGLSYSPTTGALCGSIGDFLVGSYDSGTERLYSGAPPKFDDCGFYLGAFEAVSPRVYVNPGGGSIQFTIGGDSGQPDGYNAQWHVFTYDGSIWSGSSGNHGQGTHTISIPEDTEYIAITYWSPFFYIGPTPYLEDMEYINMDTTPTGLTCATVNDAEFTGAITDTWLVSGGAIITNSALTLPSGDEASQSLLNALTENISYSAIISVTTATVQSVMEISLGTISNTVTITGAGIFTVPLGSFLDLPGPIIYTLHNNGPGEVKIDYTCLGEEWGNQGCIAPLNGNFDTADNWQWYRNAYWEEFSQMAALPYNGVGEDLDMSLVQTSRAYSMPILTEGEYLILGFQAQASDEFGLINSRVGTLELERQVYNRPYDFEIDISHLAETDVDIAFADGGTNDLLVDNVCIFISNDPPHLPETSDPEGITGVDFNFNYTCRDVPALLAGFGINVYGLQATYEAGVSVWEPQYYIPWLSAALWTNAGHPISCFIVEHMRLLAGVTQQQINEFLNFVSWTVRSANAAAPWLQTGFIYLKNAIFSPATAARSTAAGWLPWWSNSSRSLLTTIGTNWQITIDWIREATIYLSDASLGSGQDLVDTIPGVGNGFALLDLVWAMVDLVWWLWNWIFTNVIMLASLPLSFFNAFNAGIQSDAFDDMVTCSGGNFWCVFLAGVQLINQTVSESILYPIMIVGSIIVTFIVLWEDFWNMVSIKAQ